MSSENMAAFARRLGVNKSTITRAAQAGRIVLNERGLVEVEASMERWCATKGNRPDVAARHAAQRGAEVQTPTQPSDSATAPQISATDGQPGATHSLPLPDSEGRARHKAVALQYENDTIKLEMELRRGQRYLVEDAKREGHGIGATLRAAMERLIDQTAPRLAVMRSEAERRHLIAAELRRMRSVVKTDLSRAMRRLRQAGAKKGAA